MLKRKIYNNLVDWSKNSKKALLIDGARQVGKSYIIRELGKNEFKTYIEINLLENTIARETFSNINNIEDFLLRLSLIADVPNSSDCLLFIDEIQVINESDIITMSKFITEKMNFRLALSGSLLGVELNNVKSWPVGYMKKLRMHSLDFEEFLMAHNIDDKIFNYFEKCIKTNSAIDDVVHKQITEIFKRYTIIGGLPEVVADFLENNFKNSASILSDINNLYRKDISQYSDNQLKIKDIYDNIPNELNNQNKRYILKNLNENAKFRDLEDSFVWLNAAGVTIPVYNVSEPVMPLILSKSRNLFKLFYHDHGLLISNIMSKELQVKLLNGDFNMNFGSIMENIICKELFTSFERIYYYNSKKFGEIDFIVDNGLEATLIEVKSGKDYKKHSALNNILNSEEYNINKAIVLHNGNIFIEDNITYYPLYLVAFLKNII